MYFKIKQILFLGLVLNGILSSLLSNSDQAFQFDGSSYISIPDNGTLDLVSNYTIEAWVNVSDTTNNTIIDKGDYRFLFQTHPNGQTGLGLYRNGTGWIYSQGSIPANEWTHAAVTVATNGSVNFYKNAQLLSTHAGSLGSADDGLINIGRQSPDSCACNLANGQYDEIRIWNSVRSQSQILADFNKSIDGNTTGLLAYWKFNQVSGTSVTDSSSNANDGTVSGTATWVTSTAPVSLTVAHSPITDATFQDAINLWFNNQADANVTYGHISDWNTSAVTDMTRAFYGRANFNENLSQWDVSNVTKMDDMFKGATKFNQPIGDWNVSSVTSMYHMFSMASSFNQPIGNWDVSKVNAAFSMFWHAIAFNQPIGNWNTSSMSNISSMFWGATSFNQDLSDWNVSSITTMGNVFSSTISLSNLNKGLIHTTFSSNPNWVVDWREFVALDDTNFQTAVNLWFDNQVEANATYGHISDWNTSAVTNMAHAFEDRTTFNENINEWDVSNVTTMYRMFRNASSFNQSLNDWNTSSVSNMAHMFYGAIVFNQFLGDWNTTAVTNMGQMFRNARVFNQDIGDWDTSNVTNMGFMFHFALQFNQPIGDWNTRAVSSMDAMFREARAFNQDISDWNTSSDTKMSGIFYNADALSSGNRGLIHESFSSNPNWSYDWREFVVIDDSNFHSAVDLWFDNQAEANATYGHISDWNISAVTNMAHAFEDRTTFNENINAWDVSNVTTMYRMFRNTSSFNQPLNDWNTSSLKVTHQMFNNATSFNQPLGGWDTSSIWDMNSMFKNATSFDQNISGWDTISLKNTTWMFYGATSFNQNIGVWNTNSLTAMARMFEKATRFDQDLSKWNVSGVTKMLHSFDTTTALSKLNKGLIHKAFSSNPNWPYDWSEFVLTSSESPTNDSQDIKTETQKKGSFIPIVRTVEHKLEVDGRVYLAGKIEYDGNGTIEESGFKIKRAKDENATRIVAKEISEDGMFSIILDSDDYKNGFYYQAFASNKNGESIGVLKRVEMKSKQSFNLVVGAEEVENEWMSSSWFGSFKIFENGWAYHTDLGWLYMSEDGQNGLWMWNVEKKWVWTSPEVWPFLWMHNSGGWQYILKREKASPVFFDYSSGQYKTK